MPTDHRKGKGRSTHTLRWEVVMEVLQIALNIAEPIVYLAEPFSHQDKTLHRGFKGWNKTAHKIHFRQHKEDKGI
jgi:hypothetical protein